MCIEGNFKSPVSRQAVFEQARSWVGTPFCHLGRDRAGVDCVGLLIGVALALDLCPAPPLYYGKAPLGPYVAEQANQNLVSIDRKREALALGDIAVLFGIDAGVGQHFAIMGELYGKQTMIHAFSKHGKVVEHYWDTFWERRFVRAYEFPNLESL